MDDTIDLKKIVDKSFEEAMPRSGAEFGDGSFEGGYRRHHRRSENLVIETNVWV